MEGKLELADVSEFVQPVGPATIIPYTFRLFFTSALVESIVHETNRYVLANAKLTDVT